MTVVSDTIDENGKRHLVVKYTEEEKEAMRLRKEEHEKKRQEMLEKMKNKQKPKEAEEKKETPKKKSGLRAAFLLPQNPRNGAGKGAG